MHFWTMSKIWNVLEKIGINTFLLFFFCKITFSHIKIFHTKILIVNKIIIWILKVHCLTCFNITEISHFNEKYLSFTSVSVLWSFNISKIELNCSLSKLLFYTYYSKCLKFDLCLWNHKGIMFWNIAFPFEWELLFLISFVNMLTI